MTLLQGPQCSVIEEIREEVIGIPKAFKGSFSVNYSHSPVKRLL
jgi:hypothetical protein